MAVSVDSFHSTEDDGSRIVEPNVAGLAIFRLTRTSRPSACVSGVAKRLIREIANRPIAKRASNAAATSAYTAVITPNDHCHAEIGAACAVLPTDCVSVTKYVGMSKAGAMRVFRTKGMASEARSTAIQMVFW